VKAPVGQASFLFVKPSVAVIGGFLRAGKTTLILAVDAS
jgi:uncharacterized protein YaaQ